MNYQETTQYLFTAMPSFQNVGGDAYKPGLERIDSFCEALGEPQRRYKVIHIAGTNGKGSTSNMLASVLRSAGYRVGLFTSPHLRDFRERMRVDGEMISECEVIDFVAQHKSEMERIGLSFFEMTAAMAFDFFARSGVEIAVIETGLGGRLDATNIVAPTLSIITNIGLDHTQYLGTTLPQIAAEKAGIIKRGVPTILGERGTEYTSTIEARAIEMESELIFAEDRFEVIEAHCEAGLQKIEVKRGDGTLRSYDLDLCGEYQRKNLKTLLSSVEQLRNDGVSISDEALAAGLRDVTGQMSLCGRWQTLSLSPRVVCDTGHNEHGLREVAKQLASESYRELYCVLGFARDKELQKILPLFPRDAHFIFTRPDVERAFKAEEIAAKAIELGYNSSKVDVVSSVAEALSTACGRAQEGDLVFVGGSNFVVAEIV